MNTFSRTALQALVITSALFSAHAVMAEPTGSQDGGLMQQMQAPANRVSAVHNEAAQHRLDQVQIAATDEGGLAQSMTAIAAPVVTTYADRLNTIVLGDTNHAGNN
jgi:hypothetical protein